MLVGLSECRPIIAMSFRWQEAMISDSPYRSPQTESYLSHLAGAPNREELRLVAKYQRWVMSSLVTMVASNMAYIAATVAAPHLRGIMLIQMLVAVGCSIVSVALLASRIMNRAVGVLCGVLMLVPCVSLITLLIVNHKATLYLQSWGVKVGFLGANPNAI
jgi:hypothetical protein